MVKHPYGFFRRCQRRLRNCKRWVYGTAAAGVATDDVGGVLVEGVQLQAYEIQRNVNRILFVKTFILAGKPHIQPFCAISDKIFSVLIAEPVKHWLIEKGFEIVLA